VIKACSGLGRLEDGRLVHEQFIQSGCKSDVFVGSTLVDMYAKCGSCIQQNAMLFGHVKCRQGQKALELFQPMQQEGVQPNSVTFLGVLNACASVAALEEGRCVHEQIIQSGLESDVFVGSSLVDCMQNVGALWMLGECSIRCHLKVWSLGVP
jgi:pentatricopeptide repeat protein